MVSVWTTPFPCFVSMWSKTHPSIQTLHSLKVPFNRHFPTSGGLIDLTEKAKRTNSDLKVRFTPNPALDHFRIHMKASSDDGLMFLDQLYLSGLEWAYMYVKAVT